MQIGKYQLIRKLATGGMAEVFLAKVAGPMDFEKEVVVKRILPHLAGDEDFVEMFFTEAKLAARLNHPNIVQIFDFGQADGTYYLAMEYIDGLNLRGLLKRVNALEMALSPVLCSRLIATACEGLAFAHELQDPDTGQLLGLIHRDVSLDNILLSRQGAVKIVDFGIAKAANQSHHTLTGVIKGKLSYMAPEQIRSNPLDLRVDVYALGIVFYELLTGRKPFNATTEASMAQAILYEPPVPAVERRPDLPEAVSKILERALAKEREQRYPDCRAFQSELEDFILSTGKKVGVHRIAQFVSKIIDSAPTEPPAPPSSAPQASPPPPPRIALVSPQRFSPPPPPPARPFPPVPPGTAVTKAETPPKLRLVQAPPAKPSPPSDEPKPLPARALFKPHPRAGLLWALAAVGMLMAGGGIVAWRMGNKQKPPEHTNAPRVERKQD